MSKKSLIVRKLQVLKKLDNKIGVEVSELIKELVELEGKIK